VLVALGVLLVVSTAEAAASGTAWRAGASREFNVALGGRPAHPAWQGGIICDFGSRSRIICTDSTGPGLGAIYLTRLRNCRMRVEIGIGSPTHTKRAVSLAGLEPGIQRVPGYVGC
jgi:hypothetical protein